MRIITIKHLSNILVIACALATFSTKAVQAQMRPTGSPIPRQFNGDSFSVEADGKKMGIFRQIALAPALPVKSPSKQVGKKTAPIILSRGGAASMQAFENWRQQAANGKNGTALRTVMITAHDASGRTVRRYKLTKAWPIHLTMNGENAKSDPSSVTVELAYDRLQTVH